jgi:hypothetical protein
MCELFAFLLPFVIPMNENGRELGLEGSRERRLRICNGKYST